jgi:hypothetical protein
MNSPEIGYRRYRFLPPDPVIFCLKVLLSNAFHDIPVGSSISFHYSNLTQRVMHMFEGINSPLLRYTWGKDERQ